MQIFEPRDHAGHLAVGVVDVFKRVLGDPQRVLGELDDIATAPFLKQSLKQVDRILDAADVAPNLAMGNEVAIRKGLLEQRTHGRDIRRRPTLRSRGLKQQSAGQRFVVVGVVDQKLDQLALGKRLKMGTGVVERRRGVAALTKPGDGHCDAVLAEGAPEADRARAGEAKLPACGAELDQVGLGALDGSADRPGTFTQRTHAPRFEIGQAALVGARRREAGDGGGGEQPR